MQEYHQPFDPPSSSPVEGSSGRMLSTSDMIRSMTGGSNNSNSRSGPHRQPQQQQQQDEPPPPPQQQERHHPHTTDAAGEAIVGQTTTTTTTSSSPQSDISSSNYARAATAPSPSYSYKQAQAAIDTASAALASAAGAPPSVMSGAGASYAGLRRPSSPSENIRRHSLQQWHNIQESGFPADGAAAAGGGAAVSRNQPPRSAATVTGVGSCHHYQDRQGRMFNPYHRFHDAMTGQQQQQHSYVHVNNLADMPSGPTAGATTSSPSFQDEIRRRSTPRHHSSTRSDSGFHHHPQQQHLSIRHIDSLDVGVAGNGGANSISQLQVEDVEEDYDDDDGFIKKLSGVPSVIQVEPTTNSFMGTMGEGPSFFAQEGSPRRPFSNQPSPSVVEAAAALQHGRRTSGSKDQQHILCDNLLQRLSPQEKDQLLRQFLLSRQNDHHNEYYDSSVPISTRQHDCGRGNNTKKTNNDVYPSNTNDFNSLSASEKDMLNVQIGILLSLKKIDEEEAERERRRRQQRQYSLSPERNVDDMALSFGIEVSKRLYQEHSLKKEKEALCEHAMLEEARIASLEAYNSAENEAAVSRIRRREEEEHNLEIAKRESIISEDKASLEEKILIEEAKRASLTSSINNGKEEENRLIEEAKRISLASSSSSLKPSAAMMKRDSIHTTDSERQIVEQVKRESVSEDRPLSQEERLIRDVKQDSLVEALQQGSLVLDQARREFFRVPLNDDGSGNDDNNKGSYQHQATGRFDGNARSASDSLLRVGKPDAIDDSARSNNSLRASSDSHLMNHHKRIGSIMSTSAMGNFSETFKSSRTSITFPLTEDGDFGASITGDDDDGKPYCMPLVGMKQPPSPHQQDEASLTTASCDRKMPAVQDPHRRGAQQHRNQGHHGNMMPRVYLNEDDTHFPVVPFAAAFGSGYGFVDSLRNNNDNGGGSFDAGSPSGVARASSSRRKSFRKDGLSQSEH